MDLNKLYTDENAVSPIVGVLLIFGVIVVIAFAFFLTAGDLFTGAENPRIDAHFTIDAENESFIRVVYSEGDPFHSGDTERLYIIGTNSSGTSIGEITLYNGSAVVENGDANLETGTIVIDAERANTTGIDPGTSMQVIWVPAWDTNKEIILDEVVVPDADTIFQVQSESGNITGNTSIITNGTDPRP